MIYWVCAKCGEIENTQDSAVMVIHGHYSHVSETQTLNAFTKHENYQLPAFRTLEEAKKEVRRVRDSLEER